MRARAGGQRQRLATRIALGIHAPSPARSPSHRPPQFNEEMLEGCAKQSEFRSIALALSFFHACLQERKKFGVGNLPGARSGIGWNM